MKSKLLCSFLFALILSSTAAVWSDDDSFMQGKRFAAADYSAGRVCVVESDGTISRCEAARACNDLWILSNGNLLFSTGYGAKEVDSEGKVVWEYKSSAEIYAVQRLPNGNTFVGECSTGQLLEVAPDGKTIVKCVNLIPDNRGGHVFMRNARVLKNGHFLVGMYGAKKVVEFDAQGKEVWSCSTPAGVHSLSRLANGNTLVACGDNGRTCFQEIDSLGKVVWELSNQDIPGAPLKFMTGFEKLPNGNYLLTNWLGHGNFGKAPHLFEITPEKKVVWTYDDHNKFKTISNVQVFLPGNPDPIAH